MEFILAGIFRKMNSCVLPLEAMVMSYARLNHALTYHYDVNVYLAFCSDLTRFFLFVFIINILFIVSMTFLIYLIRWIRSHIHVNINIVTYMYIYLSYSMGIYSTDCRIPVTSITIEYKFYFQLMIVARLKLYLCGLEQ